MNRTLAFKLLSVSATAILLCLAVTFAAVIYQVREQTVSMTLDQARTDARATAAAVASQLNNLAGSVKVMASAVERTDVDRADVTAMLPALIEKFDLVFGSWLLEEVNSFDGQKYEPSTATGTNASREFTPYWTRGANGFELIIPDAINREESYFALPAKTRAGAATEPYVEDEAGGILMMSIAYPVITNEKLRGILGVDVGLDALSGALENQRPFGVGRVYLLSAGGSWLTAPDKGNVMKSYEFEGNATAKAAALNGKTVILEDVIGNDQEPVFRVVMPFELPGLNTRWMIVEDVPVAVVSAVVNQQTLILIAGGLVIMAAVIISLLIAVRLFIQKPIGSLLKEVGRLSEGDYEQQVAGQERKDEVGALDGTYRNPTAPPCVRRTATGEAMVQDPKTGNWQNVSGSSNNLKGKFGKTMADRYMESQGYQKMNGPNAQMTTTGHQGIDGVYRHPGPPPRFVVADAKYGGAGLGTLTDGTQQMSPSWVRGRLENAVGADAAFVINRGGYDPIFLRVDKDVNVTEESLKDVKWRDED